MSNCMGGRKVKKMATGASVDDPDYMSPEVEEKLRRKQREKEMEEKTREAYERATGKKLKTKASGGKIKGYASGGMPKAKKGRRGDGICVKGRTKGRMV